MPSVDIAKVTGSPADPGNSSAVGIAYDSTATTVKVNDSGTVKTLVETAATQTLTNKTLTSPALTTPTIGGGAALAATSTEINRVCDTSGRLVAAGGTLTVTEALHDGKIICLDTATGSVCTLPAASGSGAVYRFLVTVTATSNSHIIKVANASDEFRGFVIQDASEATAPNIWWAADNDDTITLNRTTTGLAQQGEFYEIVDAVANHFFVRGFSEASGTEATPFSATVS